MYEEDDKVLEDVRNYSKKKKSFSSVINSKNLSGEELDELFLSD